MSAVFRKTFRNYFRGMTGYVFVAAGLFLTAFGLYLFNLTTGLTTISQMLFFLSVCFSGLIPILVAMTVTRKKDDPEELYLHVLPVTEIEILLGRFFAMLLLLLLSSAGLIVAPVILQNFGEIVLSTTYVGILGYLLILANLLAISTFAGVLFRRKWLTVVVGIALNASLYLSESVLEKLPAAISGILLAMNPFLRFGNTVSGYLDVTAVVFFLSLTAFWVLVSVLSVKKNHKTAKKTSAVATLAASLLFVILLNTVLFFLPAAVMKPNISGDDTVSVSDRSVAYLNALTEDVTITYYSKCGRAGANVAMEVFLSNYAQSSDHVDLRFADLADAPEEITTGGVLISTAKGEQAYDFSIFYVYYSEDLGSVPQSDFEVYLAAFEEYMEAVQGGAEPEITEEVFYGYYIYQYYDTFTPLYVGEMMVTDTIQDLLANGADYTPVITDGKTVTSPYLDTTATQAFAFFGIMGLLLPITLLIVGIGNGYVRKKR